MLALYRAPLLHGNSLPVRNESSGNNDGSFSPVLVTFADAARQEGIGVMIKGDQLSAPEIEVSAFDGMKRELG